MKAMPSSPLRLVGGGIDRDLLAHLHQPVSGARYQQRIFMSALLNVVPSPVLILDIGGDSVEQPSSIG
jgi:hypothetical protein